MKVDLNAPTPSGITPANTKAERTSADSLITSGQDSATLSTDKASIDVLTNQVMASSELRQEKIEALRQAIEHGEYKVEPEEIAKAIIQEAS